MNVPALLVDLVLLLLVACGLLRALWGPTGADRLLAIQLFGTGGIAMILVGYGASGDEALLDIALAVALLAVLVTMTFVRRAWPGEGGQ